jgi:hypothetical protein
MKTGTHEIVYARTEGLAYGHNYDEVMRAKYQAEVYKCGESAKNDIRKLCSMTVEELDNGK